MRSTLARRIAAVMSGQKKVFTPVQIGALSLKHRIVHPALSRLRAHRPSAVPSDLVLEYYTQRASDGGLLTAEATAVSAAARPYHTAPGLWNDDQVAGWKRITDAVHVKGGRMLVQLSHAGRATSRAITVVMPVSASVEPAFWADKQIVVSTPEGFTLPSPHRALEVGEIQAIVGEVRLAAENARRAGFDGVAIQAGQGQLIEQFLQNKSNKRTDLETLITRGTEHRRSIVRGMDIYAVSAALACEAAEHLIEGTFTSAGAKAPGRIFQAEDFLHSARRSTLQERTRPMEQNERVRL
jgi:hypothetical protein